MIMFTKEQLADLLREAYSRGVLDKTGMPVKWMGTKSFIDSRNEAVSSIVHRSREGQMVPRMILPTPEQVMHVVMKFQWEDRKNGTGTTNWAANLGMTVVEYVARLNSDHGREVE